MVAMQIRDVPDDVRLALIALARSRGQSLQAYLLALVAAEARRAANVELMARFEAMPGDRPMNGAEILDEIDHARRDREPPWGPAAADGP